jgi:hypothetical protein
MAVNRDVALLGLLAGGAFIAAVVTSKLQKEGVSAEIQKARDELFDVSPGCESIAFKGGGDAPDPARLALAERYYFHPFVRRNLNPSAEAEAELMGMTTVELLTGRMLYELFPECRERAPWPPDSLLTAGMFGVIWVAMKIYMSGLVDDVRAEQQG